MKYSINSSSNVDAHSAILEVTKSLENPKLILFFSGIKGFEEYTQELNLLYPDSVVVGCTSIVELTKNGASKDSILLLGIEEGIECCGGILESVDRYPIKYVERIEECLKQMSSLENCICLEFSNAFLGCEESVLNTLNSVLNKKKVPVVGGTAGNNATETVTMVSLNGRIVDRSCVFVLIRNLGGKIKLYRENIYKSTGKVFTATKVDDRARIVYEYNHKPAAEVIAEALNTTVANLPKYLDNHPMGRIIGDKMYITANCNITNENAIVYHARVYLNSKMALLEPDNYREVVANSIDRIQKDGKKSELCIVVHCLARTLLFESEGYLQEFATLIGRELGNYVGFSGYGEQLFGQQLNQTMVVVKFEQD